MMTYYSEEQIIAEVPGLDRALLLRFVEARIVLPVEKPAERTRVFFPVDVARLSLACDLCESFELEDDALALVMGLVDQLHVVRADLQALLEAIETLPQNDRMQISRILTPRHD